jgi:hypothetical protein
MFAAQPLRLTPQRHPITTLGICPKVSVKLGTAGERTPINWGAEQTDINRHHMPRNLHSIVRVSNARPQVLLSVSYQSIKLRTMFRPLAPAPTLYTWPVALN